MYAYAVLAAVSSSYPPSQGQVAYVLLTRSPLNAEALRPTCMY